MPAKPSFIKKLERKGYYSSVVGIEHLAELRQAIDTDLKSGLIDRDLYKTYFNPQRTAVLPRGFSDARSIIVMSTPQPMLRVTFHWKGDQLKIIVPPTYYDAQKVTWHSRQALKEAFKPKEYRLVRAILPVKLLAVRSGLAKYGKNNITYIPKYGSFHRPTAFYSDFDSPVDYWREKEALPLCSKCRACFNACPTGAIQKDRFQIRSNRCLTYANEKMSTKGFPNWVPRSAHNAIVGCLMCQKVCPYDREVVGWYEDRGEFTEEETGYLLRGKFSGKKAAEIDRRLIKLGLDLTAFPRNLRVLIDKWNL